jgi:hypothetical protein
VARRNAVSLELHKWYLDLTCDGRAFIGYSARLKAGPVIHYASLLEADEAGVRTASSLRPAPVVSDPDGWSWRAPALGLEARYQPMMRGPVVDLLEDQPGALRWSVLAPLCTVTLQRGGARFSGHGYLEYIEMTVPPWRLPIERLIWGRFTHPRASLVWMDWSGPRNLLVVIRNGQRLEEAAVSSELVEGSGFRLVLGPRRVLRRGALGKVALAAVELAARVAPVGFLKTEECKTTCRARLELSGGEALEGDVIDEVVTWAR